MTIILTSIFVIFVLVCAYIFSHHIIIQDNE